MADAHNPLLRLALLLAPGLVAVCAAAILSTTGFCATGGRLDQQAALQKPAPPDEADEALPGGTATTNESIDTHEAASGIE